MFHPSPLVARLCLAAGMALVGVYVALSKPLVVALPVFLLAWLRFGIAAIAMLPWLKKPASEGPMSRRTQGLVFLESFLGNFLFSICMLYGVSMTTAVSAGVILAAIPATVALLSWLLLRERIGLRVWAAVACGVLGMGLLALSKQEHLAQSLPAPEADLVSKNPLWGNLLVFGAVLCEAAYAVIGKKLTGSIGPKRISALINLWGLALMTPMGVYLALSFPFAGVHPGIWVLLVFYAMAASIGTVWLWMTGLRVVPAAQAGVYTVLLPVATALTGVLVLGETLGAMQLLAFGVALLGVLLATLP
ncbi:drug/metabolite transporter (DMT)-like permease [Rhodoferax ferrireducens]|uniref:Drug/metabolite transporter (DMT)-like permease n=1 Tax=Rhodoferax ferrireducens TaxID=192843 RepID=A0ABU2C8V4_9BURK|nr:DMT family transporter [Rhodoferax ferrireducens]MDR7377755.1 drug/metabolite transporter (DMT)-like permease [Rhodoferax ferrireducens]